jgi:hypothetical protein
MTTVQFGLPTSISPRKKSAGKEQKPPRPEIIEVNTVPVKDAT